MKGVTNLHKENYLNLNEYILNIKNSPNNNISNNKQKLSSKNQIVKYIDPEVPFRTDAALVHRFITRTKYRNIFFKFLNDTISQKHFIRDWQYLIFVIKFIPHDYIHIDLLLKELLLLRAEYQNCLHTGSFIDESCIYKIISNVMHDSNQSDYIGSLIYDCTDNISKEYKLVETKHQYKSTRTLDSLFYINNPSSTISNLNEIAPSKGSYIKLIGRTFLNTLDFLIFETIIQAMWKTSYFEGFNYDKENECLEFTITFLSKALKKKQTSYTNKKIKASLASLSRTFCAYCQVINEDGYILEGTLSLLDLSLISPYRNSITKVQIKINKFWIKNANILQLDFLTFNIFFFR